MNDSSCLLITDVREIGQRSDSLDFGGFDLGMDTMGTTSASLQHNSTYPYLIDALKMMQQMCLDIKPERSWSIQFGISSGPGDLVVSVFIIFHVRNTYYVSVWNKLFSRYRWGGKEYLRRH